MDVETMAGSKRACEKAAAAAYIEHGCAIPCRIDKRRKITGLFVNKLVMVKCLNLLGSKAFLLHIHMESPLSFLLHEAIDG